MVLNKTRQLRELRHNSTPAEKLFWSIVHAKKFENLKFRQQHPIGNYIVDFYCAKLKLIIEIDGDSHFTEEGVRLDLIRTEYIESKGYRIIRYNNSEVLTNIDGVFQDLIEKIKLLDPPLTPP